MSAELDLYVTTSGPYRLGFVAAQIDAVTASPTFDLASVRQPGVLGIHEGMRVLHPAWFWGDRPLVQPPHYLLVVHTGACALAVDTYRLQRVAVDPAPAVFGPTGVVYGLVAT